MLEENVELQYCNAVPHGKNRLSHVPLNPLLIIHVADTFFSTVIA